MVVRQHGSNASPRPRRLPWTFSPQRVHRSVFVCVCPCLSLSLSLYVRVRVLNSSRDGDNVWRAGERSTPAFGTWFAALGPGAGAVRQTKSLEVQTILLFEALFMTGTSIAALSTPRHVACHASAMSCWQRLARPCPITPSFAGQRRACA